MNKQTLSFKENYDRLKRIANELQSQEEPDIDTLVPKVEEALAAYKVCKERIETVKAKLEATLSEQIPSDQNNRPTRQAAIETKRDLDDEVPF